jgi:hypothetical protein
MLIVYGIWALLVLLSGGTGEFHKGLLSRSGRWLTFSSFLVKDAQEDLASERQKM